MPVGLLYDVRGLVGDEACVRWRLASAEEDVAPVSEGAGGEGSGRGMSRWIIVHADVAQVGAERRLDLASNVGGQRGAGCLPLNGFGCHRAVVRCAVRGGNRQIHRQRALSDGAGAGNATRTTYRPHVLSAPPGSIPTHATTVPPDPGIHHGTGRRRVSRYGLPLARSGRVVEQPDTSGAVSRTEAYMHGRELPRTPGRRRSMRSASSCAAELPSRGRTTAMIASLRPHRPPGKAPSCAARSWVRIQWSRLHHRDDRHPAR